MPPSGSPRALLPPEHTSSPDVHAPDQQDGDEHQHLDQAEQSELPEVYGPRVEEDDLDVEQDEQHRDHAETDVEAAAADPIGPMALSDGTDLVGTERGGAVRPGSTMN